MEFLLFAMVSFMGLIAYVLLSMSNERRNNHGKDFWGD